MSAVLFYSRHRRNGERDLLRRRLVKGAAKWDIWSIWAHRWMSPFLPAVIRQLEGEKDASLLTPVVAMHLDGVTSRC